MSYTNLHSLKDQNQLILQLVDSHRHMLGAIPMTKDERKESKFRTSGVEVAETESNTFEDDKSRWMIGGLEK